MQFFSKFNLFSFTTMNENLRLNRANVMVRIFYKQHEKEVSETYTETVTDVRGLSGFQFLQTHWPDLALWTWFTFQVGIVYASYFKNNMLPKQEVCGNFVTCHYNLVSKVHYELGKNYLVIRVAETGTKQADIDSIFPGTYIQNNYLLSP